MPGALDRCRQRALVLSARSGLPSRLDHSSVGDEPSQPRDILVIDMLDAVRAEAAHLAARERPPTAATKSTTWPVSLVASFVATLGALSFVNHVLDSFQRVSFVV